MTGAWPHPTDGPSTDPAPPTMDRRAGLVIIMLFLGVVAAAVSSFVGLPYVTLHPGPITNTLGTVDDAPLITVAGASTYPTAGELNFTTVSMYGGPGNRPRIWHVLGAWLDPNSEVEPEENFFPSGVSPEEIREENRIEMTDSQEEAAAVALKALDKPVTERLVIAGFAEGSALKDTLKTGDTVLRIDGREVATIDDIRARVQSHSPGDPIELGVRRDGKDLTLTGATTTSATAETRGEAALGVYLRRAFESPVTVTINAGDVGGPSAGMMFSLAVYDVLTPGALTAGKDIAGTGTINAEGMVGAIGGVRQKLVGAVSGGATHFLAPADNCAEVTGHVPDGLRVVKVSTFDDALAAVRAIAAGAAADLPTC